MYTNVNFAAPIGAMAFLGTGLLFFVAGLIFLYTVIKGELAGTKVVVSAIAVVAAIYIVLLAYLVDHVSIHLAFAISAAVSVFLVVSYLRLVVGLHFASREAALAQFIYLVMFSYAFFLKGFTGLAITTGSVVTLFVVMQVTGRIRWADKFALKPTGGPAGELT